MIYDLPTYFCTYLCNYTYQPTLHIRTIYLPCQITVPHNLLHQRSSYTLLIVTLQQRYRHNNGILVISTTEHREPDHRRRQPYVQVCLRDYAGLKIITLSKNLQMNTENNVDSTIHSASQTLDSSKNYHFRGHHSPCSICLEERNRRVDLNIANNEQRYIPEIPCHISSEVRGYNI